MRVVIADDSVLIREGLARLLADAGTQVVGQASNAAALLGLVRQHAPHVAIVDIRMPPSFTDEGIKAAWEIRASYPSVGVLVLSQYLSTTYALKLVSRGTEALGYLVKDRVTRVAEISDAIQRIAAGETVIDPEVVARLVGRPRKASPVARLTAREREVLALVAEGRSNKAVCERLSVSQKTLATHISNIFTKLDLPPAEDDHRRVLAVLEYLRAGESRTEASLEDGGSG